jgi:hypothetical protein
MIATLGSTEHRGRFKCEPGGVPAKTAIDQAFSEESLGF